MRAAADREKEGCFSICGHPSVSLTLTVTLDGRHNTNNSGQERQETDGQTDRERERKERPSFLPISSDVLMDHRGQLSLAFLSG